MELHAGPSANSLVLNQWYIQFSCLKRLHFGETNKIQKREKTTALSEKNMVFHVSISLWRAIRVLYLKYRYALVIAFACMVILDLGPLLSLLKTYPMVDWWNYSIELGVWNCRSCLILMFFISCRICEHTLVMKIYIKHRKRHSVGPILELPLHHIDLGREKLQS